MYLSKLIVYLYMLKPLTELPIVIDSKYMGFIIDANNEPCNPTTFHLRILSEHDIVSNRSPYIIKFKKKKYTLIGKINVLVIS